MQKLVSLLALLLVISLALSCAPEAPPAPAPEAPPAPAPEAPEGPPGVVAHIVIGFFTPASWDYDPEVDGMDFVIRPEDAGGKMVRTPGLVTAKLWFEKEEGVKGDFIQEWTDIEVTEDDYAFPMGVTIRLEYQEFQPPPRQYGIIEVTFVTPDGKSFTASDRMVLGRALRE